MMLDWLYKEIAHGWQVPLAATCLFIFSVIIIRVFGLRSLSKMTSYDFAVTIALGSIIGAAAAGSITVFQGTLAILTLMILQAVTAVLIRHFSAFDSAVSNAPLLLMRGEKILYDNLAHTRMSEGELIAKLREANVLKLSQVQAVVLESTGDISVLHGSELSEELLREVRFTP